MRSWEVHTCLMCPFYRGNFNDTIFCKNRLLFPVDVELWWE
jgi:hypothetical protein